MGNNKVNSDLYANGKVFCGYRKCELECARNLVHVPYNSLPCLTEFGWKPDKNGKCDNYEPIEK